MPRAAMSVAMSVRTLPSPERGEDAVALVLRLVAVNGLGRDAGLVEAAHHLVGAVLGAGEDQRTVDRLAAQHFGQDRRLGGAIDVNDPLLDAFDGRGLRRDRDLGGIAQHLLGQFRNGPRHGGGKEQGLPSRGKFGDDFADVVDEAHVEHAVGFVEHQPLDAVEAERVDWTRSSRRPGVATRTSTPPASARTWRPIGTPPIASVAETRRWRP